jgi:hypothetical protein
MALTRSDMQGTKAISSRSNANKQASATTKASLKNNFRSSHDALPDDGRKGWSVPIGKNK